MLVPIDSIDDIATLFIKTCSSVLSLDQFVLSDLSPIDSPFRMTYVANDLMFLELEC